MTAEEERAALFCEQLQRRAAAYQARCVALAGSTTARDQLMQAWKPISDLQLERALRVV